MFRRKPLEERDPATPILKWAQRQFLEAEKRQVPSVLEELDKWFGAVLKRVFILIADFFFVAAAIGIFLLNPLLFPVSLILIGVSVLLFIWGG